MDDDIVSLSEADGASLRSKILRLLSTKCHPCFALTALLISLGLGYMITWSMHWAIRLVLYSTAPAIYARFPPTPDERVVTAPASLGTYCLSIARCVRHCLDLGRAGSTVEQVIRQPVAFVKKLLSNPGLRAMGDQKLDEAERILQSVGRSEMELAVRGCTGASSGYIQVNEDGTLVQ